MFQEEVRQKIIHTHLSPLMFGVELLESKLSWGITLLLTDHTGLQQTRQIVHEN